MKKIASFPEVKECKHPEHNAPTMIVLEPGLYEHECPSCKKKQNVFVSKKPTL